MKKNIVLITFFTILMELSVSAIFAETSQTAEQLSSGEEGITLPDVSTVIQGGAPKAGKSAVPDYSKILPERQTSELVPKLPDATANEASIAENSFNSSVSEKSIYAEGLAGLGYPGFFTGKFSVYNQTGLNPFRISFGHETMNGYAANSQTSGYFDKETLISAEKTFSFVNGKLVAKGLYNSLTNGLQNKCENISDVTKELLEAGGNFTLKNDKGFGFKTNLDGSWYRRYGNIVGNPDSQMEKFSESVNLVSILPNAGIFYNYKGFSFAFDADYRTDIDAINSFDKSVTHRVGVDLKGAWENDIFRVSADAGIVAGTSTGDNPVVVPFCVETAFSIPLSFSVRPLKLSVKGGMDSYAPKISFLEMENTFTSFDSIPSETSDWFASMDFSLPVKDSFTFSLGGVFKKTAFGNGTWTGSYDDENSLVWGQYLYSQKDMLQVNTETALSYKCKAGVFGLEWDSRWADKASNEYEQIVKANYSFQTRTSFFTFDTQLGFSPDSGRDNTPIWDFEAALKVSPAVRLAFSGTDIVKLVSGKSREYAGNYISRSGNLALLAKFVF